MPKMREDGSLSTEGKRVAIFYKQVSQLYKYGDGGATFGRYTYTPIPKGEDGFFNLVSHEMSHTMVSRMFNPDGTVMQQYSRNGSEKLADDWATFMEDYR